MKIEEVIAREEIRHTMAVYSTSGDRGRFEDLANTFTEDGVLDGRDGPVVGRKAIIESLNAARVLRLKSAGEKVGFTRHNITTSGAFPATQPLRKPLMTCFRAPGTTA